MIFKKKAKVKDIKEEHDQMSFVQEQMQRIEEQLKQFDPDSSEYAALYKEYLSVQTSAINEETLKSKKIENENKSAETELKHKERRAGIWKTTISAVSGIVAAIAIPIVEQKIGPGMSKLSTHALANIFKKKD